ncbi:MAG: methionyl-tRNA formyltransferase, partial [Actinobacteria bacterium]|nr:methionyl-tRNA formyltransferase [Actinomycetota bacterium]
MRLVFLGSPDAAIPTLRALVAAGHDVALVLSGPDRRRGRGGRRTPTPLKAAALELGLPVSADLHDVVGVGAELGVVVAFGRIIPAPVLAEVPMVNLHFSLLPRWRGAAPVERAILAGDDRSGVCVMEVAGGLDTGDVLAVAEVPIDDEVTAAELTRRLAVLGADLMVGALAGGLDH